MSGLQGYSTPHDKTVIFASHLSVKEVLGHFPDAVLLIGMYKGQLENSYAVDLTTARAPKNGFWKVVSEQECWIILDRAESCNHRKARMVYSDGREPENIGTWYSVPKAHAVQRDNWTMNPRTGDYWVIDKIVPTSPAEAWQRYADECVRFVEQEAAINDRAGDIVKARHPLADLNRPRALQPVAIPEPQAFAPLRCGVSVDPARYN